MSPEVVVDKPEALARRLVERLERAFRSSLSSRGRFALALPGGSVATTFFPHLSAADVDWARADFFWGDERAVAPDDPESNFALARSLWLEPRRVPEGRIHRMRAEDADLHEEKRWVAPVLDSPKPPPRRLTLTMPVLAAADLVVVAAMGDAKAEALRQALDEPVSGLPVAVAARRAKEAVFLLDEAAARLLSRR
jgi:6-phosphogluconolactonase